MSDIDLSGTTVLVMRALWEQDPLIETAQSLGATVVAIDQDEDAAGGSTADEFEVIDDLRNVTQSLEIAEEYDVDAVVSDQCDFSLFTTSYIGERLKLPAVPLSTAQLTTNKKRMRQALDGAVAQPEYGIASTVDEARDVAREIGLPTVFKPVDSRGAFGVSRVTEIEESDEAFLEAVANSAAREVIVEEFVAGTPVTVDGYYVEEHRSLATASKDTPLGNLDPDRELTYPAQIPAAERDRVADLTDEVVDALGVTTGATHTEYIRDEEGEFYLIECHNRGGGLQTSVSLVPALTGFDVRTQLVCDAMGVESGQESGRFETDRAGIIRPIQFEPGTVDDVYGVDELRSRQNVLVLQVFVEPGDEISEFDLATEAHGALVTVGDTPDAARSLADKVERNLDVQYE